MNDNLVNSPKILNYHEHCANKSKNLNFIEAKKISARTFNNVPPPSPLEHLEYKETNQLPTNDDKKPIINKRSVRQVETETLGMILSVNFTSRTVCDLDTYGFHSQKKIFNICL